MSGDVAEIKELYEMGEWKGLPQWRCTLCPFDTLAGEAAIVDHIIRAHFPPPPAPKETEVLRADRFGNIVEPLLEHGRVDVEVPDVSGLKVEEVLEKVDAGEISAAEALIAEKAGKNRSTLIQALEERT